MPVYCVGNVRGNRTGHLQVVRWIVEVGGVDESSVRLHSVSSECELNALIIACAADLRLAGSEIGICERKLHIGVGDSIRKCVDAASIE
jgi:hypothetical protein